MSLDKMIGRKHEFALLKKYLDDAKRASGQTILLTGESGMGKATLIKEVAESEDDVLFCHYICKREDMNKPYRPILAILDSLRSKYPKIRTPALELRDTLEERRNKREPVRNVMKFIEKVTEFGTLFIFIQNAHIADTDTIRLITEMSGNLDEKKLFLVLAYPSGEASEMDHIPLSNLISKLLLEDKLLALRLNPMTKDELTDYVRHLLDVEDVPEGFLAMIEDQTNGNPFFVKEFINNMVACGEMEKGDSASLEQVDLENICQPSSIEEMVEARLNELSEEELELLECASVWGMEFRTDKLAKIAKRPQDEVKSMVNDLENSGFLFKHEQKKDTYRFEHTKMHEAVYRTLGNRKRDLHLKAASILEKEEKESADSIFTLAYHYSRSRDIDKAIKYTVKAAERSIKANAPRSALRFAESAMRLLEGADINDETTMLFIRTEEMLADLYFTLGRWDESLEKYQTLVEASRELDDRSIGARAYIGMSEVYKNKGKWEDSHEMAVKGLKISQEENLTKEMSQALRNLGYISWRLGNYDQAQDYYNKCIAQAAKTKDMETMGTIYIEIGNLTSVRGKLEEAAKIYQKSIKILEGIKNLSQLARAYNNLGDVYLQKEEWKRALQYFNKSKEMAEKAGDKNMSAWAQMNSGEALSHMGELENAIENLKQALQTLKSTGDQSGMSGAYKTMGIAYGISGKWDEAMDYFNLAIDMNKKTKTPDTLADTYYIMGKLLKKSGEDELAEEYLNKGLAISKKIGADKITERIEGVLNG